MRRESPLVGSESGAELVCVTAGRANTTASFTWWHGRTLNPFLQNAVLASGMKVSTTPGVGVLDPSASGQHEPWLNRLQFDLIYTF